MNFTIPHVPLRMYVEARYMDALTSSQHTTMVPITFDPDGYADELSLVFVGV